MKTPCVRLSIEVFLSTLSLRRATRRGVSGYLDNIDFYPRSPCGERPAWNRFTQRRDFISIHALLAESDPLGYVRGCSFCVFLSTLSLRRATHYDNYNLHCVEISIHALLAESDTPMTFRHCTTYLFLSTLSLRRATLGRGEAV